MLLCYAMLCLKHSTSFSSSNAPLLRTTWPIWEGFWQQAPSASNQGTSTSPTCPWPTASSALCRFAVCLIRFMRACESECVESLFSSGDWLMYVCNPRSSQPVKEGIFSEGACCGFYSGEITMLMGDIGILRPTIFPSVPRLLNKLYDKVLTLCCRNAG